MAYDPLEDMRQSALCPHSAWMHKARERFGCNTGPRVCGACALPRDHCEDSMRSVGIFLDGKGERRDGALQNVPGASASRQSPFFWKLALLGSFEEIRA